MNLCSQVVAPLHKNDPDAPASIAIVLRSYNAKSSGLKFNSVKICFFSL